MQYARQMGERNRPYRRGGVVSRGDEVWGPASLPGTREIPSHLEDRLPAHGDPRNYADRGDSIRTPRKL